MPPPPTSQVQRFSAARETSSGGGEVKTGLWAARPATSEVPNSTARKALSKQEFSATSQSLDLSGGQDGGAKGDFLLTLPSNIQDSLKVFEELQSQKTELLTSSAKLTARSPQITPPILTARSASTGRIPVGKSITGVSGRQQTTNRNDKESERKLQIAESVMKKLHKKNQKLTKEVEEMRDQQRTTGTTPAEPASVTMQQRDAKIQSLEAKVRLLEGQLKYSSGGGSSGAQSGAKGGQHSSAMFKSMQDKHVHLQQQYSEILDSKIDTITGAASTAKINKEVKSFFVTLRKKVHSDLLEHEIERQVWNAGMAQLEDQLCDQYLTKRMEAEAAG